MKLSEPKFTGPDFTATKWDSGEVKAKFANHLLRFIERGYPSSMFTKVFYRRLSMTFGHIAHYSWDGFWGYFFEDDAGRRDFMDHTMNGGGYGDPAFTYSDVELAVRKRLRQRGRSS